MSQYIYDLSPYADIAYYQTHPGHMAAVSLARGHKAPVGNVRVLELGCGSGFNLLAMSMSNPDNEYVGIDLSRVQIENGKAIAAEIGAQNVTLHACSIEDFADGGEQFHYIIAHGFYCWVPPTVRDSMFAMMKRLLAPDGVAYVSYNTNPGWRLRSLMRDGLRFLTPADGSPAERVAQVRTNMGQLADSFLDAEGMYAQAFRDEWTKLNQEQDYYFLHEYLADFCDPLYFEEFVKHAAGHGLRFLAESRYWTNAHAQPQAVRADLERVGGDDLLRREQYLDWMAGRYFRQTLLIHAERNPPGELDPEGILKLRILSDPDTPEEIGDPMRDAVLAKLAEGGVEPLPASAIGAEIFGPVTFLVPTLLVQGWAEGHWALRADTPVFASKVSERPEACPLARLQATSTTLLTNRLHRRVDVTAEEQQVLLQLDGTRAASEFSSQSAVLDALAAKALLAR
ncbi:MAG: methyltransferase regulatory domain-containing protein [Acidobacteria bacterium]|nr:methyltransferase regulatory domain-containing protein [Acidobacteriota bacterium]